MRKHKTYDYFMNCRHCGEYRSCRARKLCWNCFNDIRIREKYPSGQYRAPNGGNREPPLPDQPTDALPGSLAKVAVMELRTQMHKHIHHPMDAKIPF